MKKRVSAVGWIPVLGLMVIVAAAVRCGDDSGGGTDGAVSDSAVPSDGGVSPGLPAIYFLDVTSAQVGDFIVVRGRGFLSSGTLWFGSVEAADVRLWSDTRIVSVVPAGAGGPVTVETTGGHSNPQSFSTHTGNRIWVSPSGSDTNAGTEADPLQTVHAAVDSASPGDTIVVREGVYQELDSDVMLYLRARNSGTEQQPLTLRGYPGETVVLDGSTAQGTTVYVEASYTVVTGFEIRNSSGQNWVSHGDHNRVVDCDIHDANVLNPASSGSGVNIGHGSFGVSVIGNHIHHNGSSDLDHGMYIKGDSMLIAHNDVHDNFGFGIQMYNGPGEQWHDALVVSNVTYRNRKSGIIVSIGSTNTLVFNNVAFENDECGIIVQYQPVSATIILNNTVYGNGRYQMRIGDATATVLRNNIFGGSGDMFRVDPEAVGVDSDYNLWGADGSSLFNWHGSTHDLAGFKTASIIETNSFTADPLFVNEAAYDFHLQSTSPAIDAAEPTYAPAFDAELRTRPFGTAPDIGAYEYTE